jgi:hypothetical protein
VVRVIPTQGVRGELDGITTQFQGFGEMAGTPVRLDEAVFNAASVWRSFSPYC